MYLYVIGPNNGSRVKLGFSKNPEQRLKTLQTAQPEKLLLHYKEKFTEQQIRLYERTLHRELAHHRLSGEWFALTPEEATLHIKHLKLYYEDQEYLLR